MNSPQDDKDSFFIGWAETSRADRRHYLKFGLGFTVTSGMLGFGLAALQPSPGKGRWDPDLVREWRGLVTGDPYAMLRTKDLGAGPSTVLLSCLGKCGVAARIGALSGQAVIVTGSLIQRGQHAMIAVDEAGPWIRRDETIQPDTSLRFPNSELLGEVELTGEILDSKCWFGAMRPSEGKVHKSCASLCIRGGIPPAFFARGPGGQDSLMIMSSKGRAYGPELLSLVGDLVRLRGRVFRQGNLLWLDTTLKDIRRI
jgi:hypothetical protein